MTPEVPLRTTVPRPVRAELRSRRAVRAARMSAAARFSH